MADNKYGFRTTTKHTRKFGGPDGIQGGGHKYLQLHPPGVFNVVRKQQRNINTDAPYGYHISK